MPTEVTDPKLLEQLNAKEVTDPDILRQLNGEPEATSIPRSMGQRIRSSAMGVLGNDDSVQGELTGRVVRGGIKNAVDMAKGAYNAVTHPYDTARNIVDYGIGAQGALNKLVGIPKESQALGSYPQEQVSRGEQLFEPTKKNIQESIKNPQGIPGRAFNYAIDNPLNTAVNISTLRGIGGTAAKAPTPSASLEGMSKNVYGSAGKLPLTKKWVQELPTQEISKREAVIKQGIANRVPWSDYGKQKAIRLATDTQEIIDGIIGEGAKGGDLLYRQGQLKSTGITGAGNAVHTDTLLKGLDNAYIKAASSSDPVGAMRMIDSVAEKFMKRPGVLSSSELQKIKKQMYKEADSYTGEFKDFYDSAHKGIAHEAMSILEKMHPELRMLNRKEAAYIGLKEAMEKSVAREGNKNLGGLDTKVLLASQNWLLGIFNATLGHPYIKSQLSFALDKASKAKTKNPIKWNAILQSTKINQNEQPEPRADGGPVNPNQPYLVGEKGPEVIVPQQPGTVIPNQLTPQQPQQQQQNQNWGNREDGTPKGNGWLGVLQRPDGKVSTEISIGVNINGKETEIPTLVPTLTKEEVNYLLTNNPEKQDLFDTPMGKSIMKKAYDHALEQIRSGKSPFKQESMAAPNQLMAQQAPQQQPQQKIPIGQPGDPRAVPLIQLQKQLKDAAVKDDWNEVDRLNKLIQKVQATG